jgi:trehalose 2-sulfotransferase
MRGLVVIAAQPRTGSELLGGALEDTGFAGRPGEYFAVHTIAPAARKLGVPRGTLRGHLRELPALVRARRPHPEFWPTRRSVVEYIQAVHSRTSTPNGIAATKLFWREYEQYFVKPGLVFDEIGMPVWAIRLGRRDRVAQAVSLHIAQQTRRWRSEHASRLDSPPVYDLDSLRRCFLSLERDAAGWDAWFEEHRPDAPVLVYEEVVADLAGAVDTVLSAIGETRTNEIVPRQARMADERNAEWIERFLEEAPDLAARRWWSPPGASPGGPARLA